MYNDDIFNALCRLWFEEEVRLEAKAQNSLDVLLRSGGSNHEVMLDYIESCARLNYFRDYIVDVLKWLSNFR